MADFESIIKDAIAAKEIPGCALVATSRDGSFTYSKAFGSTSMDPSTAAPMDVNTIMWVASCTKLMTSICAMQLVERGQTTLDEPVYTHIPELKSFNVITGFTDTGVPIEEPHKAPITLRNLLTHSSGLTYDSMHPKALAWLKHHGKSPGSSGKLLERFFVPLVFEPGESWSYGPGLDYAGLLVERISGLTLEEYMKKNIWEPLGMTDITFFPSTRPDLQKRTADMSERDAEGKVRVFKGNMPYLDGEGKEITDCMGGQGTFTCASEYIKVLKAVLDCDEGGEGKLLKKESIEEFFKPQLGDGSRGMLNAVMNDDMANNAMGGAPKHITKDYGLGGLILTSDSPDGKKAGIMIWGGYPNLIWWIDRKMGLCGLYAGQVVPPGDAKCAALTRKWEEGVYGLFEKHKEGVSKL